MRRVGPAAASLAGGVRAADWWHYKVPPVLAIAYYLLYLAEPRPSLAEALSLIAVFLVAVVGVAGFGHVLNDLFDLEQDAAVGKVTAMARLGPLGRMGSVLACLVLGAAPWLYLPADRWNLSLVGLQLALFVGYSCPPLRLKERVWLGPLTDALYAYAVPVLITWTTFSQLGPAAAHRGLVFATLSLWALCVGLRCILSHQLIDALADGRAGVTTLVTRHGRPRAFALLARVVVPAELGLFAAATILLWADVKLCLIGAVIYLPARAWQLKLLWPEAVDSETRLIQRVGFFVLNSFYERWWPLLFLAAVVAADAAYLVLAALHLAAFRNGPVTLLLEDLRQVRAAVRERRRKREEPGARPT